MTNTDKWYYFWLKIGYRSTKNSRVDYETYRQFPDGSYIEDFCDDWADTVVAAGGGGYDYEYDYEEVEKPPKEWLEKEIQSNINMIKYRENINKVYSDVLNSYQLNEKIEKIKNNIKN